MFKFNLHIENRLICHIVYLNIYIYIYIRQNPMESNTAKSRTPPNQQKPRFFVIYGCMAGSGAWKMCLRIFRASYYFWGK